MIFMLVHTESPSVDACLPCRPAHVASQCSNAYCFTVHKDWSMVWTQIRWCRIHYLIGVNIDRFKAGIQVSYVDAFVCSADPERTVQGFCLIWASTTSFRNATPLITSLEKMNGLFYRNRETRLYFLL